MRTTRGRATKNEANGSTNIARVKSTSLTMTHLFPGTLRSTACERAQPLRSCGLVAARGGCATFVPWQPLSCHAESPQRWCVAGCESKMALPPTACGALADVFRLLPSRGQTVRFSLVQPLVRLLVAHRR